MGFKRHRQFVDAPVQGLLLTRAIFYWCAVLASATAGLLFWRILTGEPQPLGARCVALWHELGPVLVASLLLLPLVAWDSVRLSNRFVGPMLRMRRTLRELANGQRMPIIFFRDDDFWHDFADDFNRVIRRIELLQHETKTTEPEQPARAPR